MASRIARTLPLAAFVLHSYDWSESSLILDLFTREQGRIAAAAKGAKRPFSQLRGVLLPFQRIAVTLGRHASGEEGAEVSNLRGADWSGGPAMLTGAALFSGFYLNELLMKLLARHDPHPALFDAYAATIAALGDAGEARGQSALRAFEIVLLKEIGLLPDLGIETATGRPVRGRASATASSPTPASSPRRARPTPPPAAPPWRRCRRRSPAATSPRCSASPRGALAELRPLLRAQLAYHLGTDSLRTRRVMLEAQALTPAST